MALCPARALSRRTDAIIQTLMIVIEEDLTMDPWRLAELNYGQIKGEAPFEVAVLPLGATEPHNLHLPYGTDTFQVEVIAGRACAGRTATGRGSCSSRRYPTGPRPTR